MKRGRGAAVAQNRHRRKQATPARRTSDAGLKVQTRVEILLTSDEDDDVDAENVVPEAQHAQHATRRQTTRSSSQSQPLVEPNVNTDAAQQPAQRIPDEATKAGSHPAQQHEGAPGQATQPQKPVQQGEQHINPLPTKVLLGNRTRRRHGPATLLSNPSERRPRPSAADDPPGTGLAQEQRQQQQQEEGQAHAGVTAVISSQVVRPSEAEQLGGSTGPLAAGEPSSSAAVPAGLGDQAAPEASGDAVEPVDMDASDRELLAKLHSLRGYPRRLYVYPERQADLDRMSTQDVMRVHLQMGGFVVPEWAQLLSCLDELQGCTAPFDVPRNVPVAMLRRMVVADLFKGAFWPQMLVLSVLSIGSGAPNQVPPSLLLDTDMEGRELSLADCGLTDGARLLFKIRGMPSEEEPAAVGGAAQHADATLAARDSPAPTSAPASGSRIAPDASATAAPIAQQAGLRGAPEGPCEPPPDPAAAGPRASPIAAPRAGASMTRAASVSARAHDGVADREAPKPPSTAAPADTASPAAVAASAALHSPMRQQAPADPLSAEPAPAKGPEGDAEAAPGPSGLPSSSPASQGNTRLGKRRALPDSLRLPWLQKQRREARLDGEERMEGEERLDGEEDAWLHSGQSPRALSPGGAEDGVDREQGHGPSKAVQQQEGSTRPGAGVHEQEPAERCAGPSAQGLGVGTGSREVVVLLDEEEEEDAGPSGAGTAQVAPCNEPHQGAGEKDGAAVAAAPMVQSSERQHPATGPEGLREEPEEDEPLVARLKRARGAIPFRPADPPRRDGPAQGSGQDRQQPQQPQPQAQQAQQAEPEPLPRQVQATRPPGTTANTGEAGPSGTAGVGSTSGLVRRGPQAAPPSGMYIDTRTNAVRQLGTVSGGDQRVKPKRFWTADETRALLQGIKKHRHAWREIFFDYGGHMPGRTDRDYKDRWANLQKAYRKGWTDERVPLASDIKQMVRWIKDGLGEWPSRSAPDRAPPSADPIE